MSADRSEPATDWATPCPHPDPDGLKSFVCQACADAEIQRQKARADAAEELAEKYAHRTKGAMCVIDDLRKRADEPCAYCEAADKMMVEKDKRTAELTDALRHAVDELNHYGHLNDSQTGEPTPASHIYAKALADG